MTAKLIGMVPILPVVHWLRGAHHPYFSYDVYREGGTVRGTRSCHILGHASKSERRILSRQRVCICIYFPCLLLAHSLWSKRRLAFSPNHLEYTFFACLAAYWCQWTIGVNTVGTDATLSKFQQTTGYFCNLDSPTNMLGYILMAVIGGMMGALFNSIVEHLNHIRAHHIHKSAVKRMLEVVVLALLTGTAVIYLPMSAPCSIAGRSS